MLVIRIDPDHVNSNQACRGISEIYCISYLCSVEVSNGSIIREVEGLQVAGWICRKACVSWEMFIRLKWLCILMHAINADQRAELVGYLMSHNGVEGAHFTTGRDHLLLVDYDHDRLHAQDVLGHRRESHAAAQLVGPM